MIRPLRILLICHQDGGGTPHPIPAYRFWRNYFASAFAESGHTLIEIPEADWAWGLTDLSKPERKYWLQKIWQRTCDFIRQEHQQRPIDLILSYLYPQQILAAALKEIRELQIPTVNFFCDNVREFRQVPAIYRHFDLHWVPEFKALALYSSSKLPVLHAPMPCWVAPEYRSIPREENNDVVFIGRYDDLRARLFEEAFALGLDAVLYGSGWIEANPGKPITNDVATSALRNQWDFVHQHGIKALFIKLQSKVNPLPPLQFDFSQVAQTALSSDHYLTTTREAKTCLGVNRYPSPRDSLRTPETYSRLRDIEAPMTGACYLTEWTEGLDQYYDLGTEIETYRNASELAAKAQELSEDQKRRTSLRCAGQKRALSDHSINKTLTRLTEQLGIS